MISRLPAFIALLVLSTTRLAAIESDDFDAANLDSVRWTFVNPLGDGWLEVSGSGTSDATLSLSLPEGVSHDPWQVNRAPRVMQATGDGDFEAEIRFESEPSARYHMQGFVVEQDPDNWIRFDALHDGTTLRIFAGTTTNGSSSAKFNTAIPNGGAEFMRIGRSGDDWTLDIAGADTVFTNAGAFSHALTVNAVGLFVANHANGGGPSPAFTAVVDYVFDTTSPILPEDGSAAPDTLPPFIHGIEHAMAASELVVTWRTDEPSTGTVAYGTSAAYEFGTIPTSGGLSTTHQVTLPGLTQGETYHYQVCAEDGGSRQACATDVAVLFDPSGPDISIWYGLDQAFGTFGQPQPWANVLGHVSDPDGVASLSYTLNGGSPVALSIGPDGRRLENPGDFNVDPATSALMEGPNTIVVTAIDGVGSENTATVTVDYTSTTVWPLPYEIDWSTLSGDADIQNVAQVVDGKWHLEGGTVRTTEPGYDRLIAVGDSAWTDVEFLTTVTLETTPGGFGAGVLLRWNGHTNTPVSCGQPQCGYLPLGGILWLRPGRLEIYGNDSIIYDSAPVSVQPGVTYWLRGRVETTLSGGLYSAKVWEDGQAEPPGWLVQGQGDLDDPLQGSLLLISHQADAIFGTLTVSELGPPVNLPPTANDDVAYVAPGDSVDVVVLANDTDVDGSLDATTVTIASTPVNGTADVDPVSGVITYVHDGSATDADSLTYTVEDDDGEVSNAATLRLVVSDDPPPSLVSDDFNRCELGSHWTYVDPFDDGEAALVGTGSGDAHLAMSFPAGTGHDAWGAGGVNETARVMQTTDDIGFQMDVKWNTEPTAGFNDQGILVEQDDNDWLRFDVYHNNTSLKLFVGRTVGGSNNTLLNATIPTGSATHVRVNRTGNTWTTFTSGDGVVWVQRHSFAQPLVVNEVGVYAGNPVDGLAFTSEVDYVRLATDPIPDEDGDTNEIVVDVVGQGSVTANPDQTVYACDDVVELTATPDAGWVFVGWSGDLSGSTNPALLTVTGKMGVTATFENTVAVEDASPPVTFAVLGVSPNPSAARTAIRFRLPSASPVDVRVMDVAGRLVRRLVTHSVLPEGTHAVTWDGKTAAGKRVAPGVYFVVVETPSASRTTRLLRME